MSDKEKDLEELDDVVELTDEDGNVTNFELLDTIEMDGTEYVVLLPMDEEETEEVVIMRLERDEEDDETVSVVSVDSEEEINKVFDLFKERNADDFDFVD